MSEREAMPRGEVFRFVAKIGATVLANEPVPCCSNSYEVMRVDDLADALRDFKRQLAEDFDKVPAAVSDDLAVQKEIRRGLDRVMSYATLRIEAALETAFDNGVGQAGSA